MAKSKKRNPAKNKPRAMPIRLFSEKTYSPDETVFQINNTSNGYYNSPYYKLHQANLQSFPKGGSSHINLADIIGQIAVDTITQAGRIIFHSVGDTGAAKSTGPITESKVADMMVSDFNTPVAADRPSFFFHLGDVIYYFGETQYYYDQFYEPFRNYDAPIFAIPGNHDGMIYQATMKSLDAFQNNFCTAQPQHATEAGSLVRTTMTQPNVYFTLDAPFVSIIGLYSNVLEGPGVISSENGAYPIPDDQKNYLVSELQRLKSLRANNNMAVIVALHHPPFSGDAKHSGTTGLMNDLDDAFTKAGLLPDMVLSGHAHIYQRFTRTMNNRNIPYLISGSGGFAMTPIKNMPSGNAIPKGFQDTATAVTLNEYIAAFGYLKLVATKDMLGVQFNSTDPQYGEGADSIFINLSTNVITPGKKGQGLI
jgi:hypothetical protein